MRAFIFPGQGSQAVGMGKDFYDHFPAAKAVFDEVDEALPPLYGKKLSQIIFEGPEEVLTETLYTQAALMTTSLAMCSTLEAELGEPLRAYASFMAGHSLGEYSALVTAGVLTLKDAATLLYFRGKSMTECAPKDGGAMAAIMGLESDIVSEITQAAGCYVANDNGGMQVVISGTKDAVAKAMNLATEKGAKRALSLSVSAPFHCPLMQGAADVMEEKVAAVPFQNACIPIVTNVQAAAVNQAETFQKDLIAQVCGQVRWRESILFLEKKGVTDIMEIGSGKVLTNLVKRISPSIQATSLSKIDDLENILVLLSESKKPSSPC